MSNDNVVPLFRLKGPISESKENLLTILDELKEHVEEGRVTALAFVLFDGTVDDEPKAIVTGFAGRYRPFEMYGAMIGAAQDLYDAECRG